MESSLQNNKGMTFIEMLVVMAIISILFASFFYIWNTMDIFRKSRDSKRINDLQLLDSALKTLLSTERNINLGQENVIYTSLPDSSSTCGSYNLLPLFSPYSYRCQTSQNYLKVDGNGWLPVNFTLGKILMVSVLPIDPLNNKDYFYAYQVRHGRYKLTARFETKTNISKMANDGGFEPTLYEVGSDLFIPSPHSGLVGYWSFDEGTGTIAYDLSGYGNNGILNNFNFNETSGWTTGKIGKALIFDGVDDYVKSSTANGVGKKIISECLWIKFNNFSTENQFGYIRSSGTLSARYFYFSTWCSVGVPHNCVHLGTLNTDGTWGRSVATSRNFETGRWYFICGVIDTIAGSIKVYIDSSLFYSAAMSTGDIPGIPSEIWIGGTPENYQWANSIIDEPRIYNRALSPAEIKALYEATR
jgi:prepilin-type N-terminal cleavage/methylation domain-containing protein